MTRVKILTTFPKRTASERLEARIVRGPDCWGWTGALDDEGYAVLSLWARPARAARAMLALIYGPLPPGMVVRHKCDNRVCVNPDHLTVGSQADNIADKVARDRQARGTGNAAAKLTEPDVRDIRARHAAGASAKALAREYGVNPRAITFVVRGTTWRHVQ